MDPKTDAQERTQNGNAPAKEVQQLPKGQSTQPGPLPLPNGSDLNQQLANSLSAPGKNKPAKKKDGRGDDQNNQQQPLIKPQPGQQQQQSNADEYAAKRFYLQGDENEGGDEGDDGNEGDDSQNQPAKQTKQYKVPAEIQEKLTAAEQANATLTQLLSDPDIKSVLEAKKTGKTLFQVVSEYQALDPKNKTDEQLLKDYVINDLELKETDPDYAKMMEELNGSITLKREAIVKQRKKQEAEYQEKLKSLPEIQPAAQSQDNENFKRLGKEVSTLMSETKGKYFGNIEMNDATLSEVQSFIKSGAPLVPLREDGSIDAKEYLNMVLYANPKTRKIILTEAYNDGASDVVQGKVFKQFQGTANRNQGGNLPAKRAASPNKSRASLISGLAEQLNIKLPNSQ